ACGARHRDRKVSGGWRRLARVLPRRWRNWLRSPAATLKWAWDDLRHRGGADLVAELRPGWRIRCHPAAWRMAYRVHQEDEEQARYAIRHAAGWRSEEHTS